MLPAPDQCPVQTLGASRANLTLGVPVPHNAACLELALTGIDLLAWTRTLLLHGELAQAEPKKLRTGWRTYPRGSPAPPGKPGRASPKPGPWSISSPRSVAEPHYPDR